MTDVETVAIRKAGNHLAKDSHSFGFREAPIVVDMLK